MSPEQVQAQVTGPESDTFSLGSVLAAGLHPLACWLIMHPDWPVMLASVGAAILIITRHRGNIQRIRAGEERIFRFQREGR